jgi:hypothetical protein
MRRGVSRKRPSRSAKAASGVSAAAFVFASACFSYLQILRIGISDFGGAEGSRTLDLLNAIQALSQLSYGPTQEREA